MAHSFQALMFLRRAGACALLAGWFCGAAQAEEVQPSLAGTLPASMLDARPHIGISNGLVSAMVFPPGKHELYQGTRFDHAGVVLHITYKGQDYSQYWFDRYATNESNTRRPPGISVQRSCCAVSGPVEEFAPVGFDEAGMGGAFLKPGIGILKRDADIYTQFVPFPILNEGRRTVRSSANSVRFTQDLRDEKTGYGYSYVKTVRLTPGRAQMTIAHVLRNTGRKDIVTTVYNHNFLTLSPGNENVVITAPFSLQPTLPLQPDLARVEGPTLRYLAPVPQGTTVTSPIAGFSSSSSDYDFHIVNSATGFGVRMRADQPLASINFWSVHTVLGWEPYIAIALKPGETKSWTNTYDYSGPGEQ